MPGFLFSPCQHASLFSMRQGCSISHASTDVVHPERGFGDFIHHHAFRQTVEDIVDSGTRSRSTRAYLADYQIDVNVSLPIHLSAFLSNFQRSQDRPRCQGRQAGRTPVHDIELPILIRLPPRLIFNHPAPSEISRRLQAPSATVEDWPMVWGWAFTSNSAYTSRGERKPWLKIKHCKKNAQ